MVVGRHVCHICQRLGIAFGGRADFGVVGVAVVHPENAGPEARAPLLTDGGAAVPSLMCVACKDITRLLLIIVGLEHFKCAVYLHAAIIELLLGVERLGEGWGGREDHNSEYD